MSYPRANTRNTVSAGYHLVDIPRGVYGDSSKIMEEVLELVDADKQSARIMALCEVSDIVGAVLGYLAKHHPGITLDDVLKMVDITRRAFESGHRKPSPEVHVAKAVFGIDPPLVSPPEPAVPRGMTECYKCKTCYVTGQSHRCRYNNQGY